MRRTRSREILRAPLAWVASICAAFGLINIIVLAGVWYPNGLSQGTLFLVQLAVAILLIGASVRIGGVSFWLGLAFAVLGWPTVWVLFGFFHFVTAYASMSIAAMWWVVAVAIVLGRMRPQQKPTLALLAVTSVVFPIALVSNGATTAPSEIRLNAVTDCNAPVVVPVLSVQSVVFSESEGERDRSKIPWKDSQTVAFLNGQALAPVEFPSLLPEGDALWQRFIAEKGQAGPLTPVRTPTPAFDAMVTVYTLGQTRVADWDGAFIADCSKL